MYFNMVSLFKLQKTNALHVNIGFAKRETNENLKKSLSLLE
mgnify:CR=1 FL=1